MDNLIYILFICMAVPLALSMLLMEGKVRQIVIFLFIGICCCFFISEVNGLILKLLDHDTFYVTTTLTPITEEIIKAIPVFVFAFVVTSNRNRLYPIALATGIGFALLENMIILVQDIESVTVLWALGRGFASSLMHGVCTAAVGFGLSYIHQKKKLVIPGTFSLLLSAICFHAIFNCLVQSDYPVLGLVLPVVTYIPIVTIVIRNRRKTR